jgi:hypothetical protein
MVAEKKNKVEIELVEGRTYHNGKTRQRTIVGFESYFVLYKTVGSPRKTTGQARWDFEKWVKGVVEPERSEKPLFRSTFGKEVKDHHCIQDAVEYCIERASWHVDRYYLIYCLENMDHRGKYEFVGAGEIEKFDESIHKQIVYPAHDCEVIDIIIKV